MQDTSMVRNIAILGHGSSGKSSLAEAMLFTAGKIKRLGTIDGGNSSMDYDDEEIARKISINSSFENYIWKKTEVYLIDTPGDDSFYNETIFASKVSDGAVFNIGAVLGVKGQTIKFADLIAENQGVLVLDLWASSCLSCIREYEASERNRALIAEKGVKFERIKNVCLIK